MSIYNIKKYKESLLLLPDIEIMLKILNLTEKTLSYYTHYLPAFRVLTVVKEQKIILNAYYKELSEIKKSKGKKVFNNL
jgi:hypothetical protein